MAAAMACCLSPAGSQGGLAKLHKEEILGPASVALVWKEQCSRSSLKAAPCSCLGQPVLLLSDLQGFAEEKKVGGKNGCCCEAGECGGQKSSSGEREDGTDGDVSGQMRKGYGNGFEMQQYDGQEDHRQVEGAKLNMMGVSWHGQMKCIEKHMT
ncbi:hypothetical protein R3P38DRAFT_2790790 [Favolaschia claudopus]|uniref:Uncharacterized protein n=1 Tax=Favolaschia claudopus TaxID=2862362 RepID=A0AAW0AHR7_9AGAR